MKKEKVLLLGASGSMGSAAFKLLWAKKDEKGERKYDVVLLQRPSGANKRMFAPYEKECGIASIPGRGVAENNGLKIVWGDATDYEDMLEAAKGVDWVLCPMAFISPEADRNPEMAGAVNATAIGYIVKAIEAQPGGAEHIRLIYIGSVAQTGDRLPPIHWGRVGDPLKPSMFDFYATTKIAGERAVLESSIRHWASLRQTFIMIPDVMSLEDPIMFHQPINSYMESNTMNDAGRGLINCLDIPHGSPFWRRVYNMAGGPRCRCTYLELMKITYDLLGIDYRNVLERKWFALRNFHMQFYEDSGVLDGFIHNWGDSIDTYREMVRKSFPWYMKLVAALNRSLPPFRRMVERQTRRHLKALCERKDGTLGWLNNNMELRIKAFFGSREAMEKIPDWGDDMPDTRHDAPFTRLDHGYDESKKRLDLSDLAGAAKFRGGELLSGEWNGDLYSGLRWRCAFGHEFGSKPYTVIKAGHWCPECTAPPWNYDEIAHRNPFFAQVWYPNHGREECNFYPEDCYTDIEGVK